MSMRIWKNSALRSLLVAAALSATAVGCGEGADVSADDEPTVAAQVVGARLDGGAATETRCAVQYTECLLGAWDDVLGPGKGIGSLTECTRKAETCGLFENAPDAGTNLTPTCGFEVADCYLKNPSNPSKCQELPCRKAGASAPSTP